MEQKRQLIASFLIPSKPIPQCRPRFSRTGGVYYSPKVQAYRKEATLTLREQARGNHLTRPIDYPIMAVMVFHGANPSSDLDNQIKILLDCAVDAGVLSGDNVGVVSALDARAYPAAKGVEHTILEIWRENAQETE